MGNSKYIYLTASGQAVTGTAIMLDLIAMPAATTDGNVIAYKGTASGAASAVMGRIVVPELSLCGGIEQRLNPKKEIVCDGGIYVTLTGVTGCMVEVPENT